MAAQVYSQDQLTRYLEHISYPRSRHPRDELQFLKELQAHHLARVPFESISLHYSPHRTLSVDADDLFQKVVEKSRGGYCVEMNTIFGDMMRALGFNVLSIGARVKPGPVYLGMTHSANIVTINQQRYLVDVAFGSHGAFTPVPLINGHEFDNILPRRGKLEFRPLAQSTSPSTQSLWVYSTQDLPSTDWTERYCFTETELFRADYDVMNFYCSTVRTAVFVNNVFALRGILNEKGDGLQGVMTLLRNEVRRRVEGVPGLEVVETLVNEEDRVKALEKWSKIPLSKREATAIRGLPTELVPPRHL
ncbi:N-acetyltransferase [Trichoderma gamsii]|uniref:N-acetyltransferase n=1 Tax=Trichoderma gamsii TaxID=398673 RepID=A0A2P4ZQK9_9HYPO|nr:N-acetyltransferase [Trichoderma gamsii]PON26589.1 N-acetyltransferase [Trichoderma gamsii]